MNLHKSLYPLFALVLLSIVYSCASPGNPSGGPQDKTPPIFINSHPKPNATNVNNQKLELIFDEIVTLKDPSTKIIVSPAQTEQPKITANGRKVTVEIIDTLLENTTYTVDFSNAIQDNNEGNPLYNFAFAFSTGEQIDTMRVSGIVLDSHTLEPMQGVVVGLHDDLSDSAFFKTKMKRVALTNDRGQFTIRNLKPGKYHIFGLKDLDRDYKFANPTEDIAFCDSIIIPAVEMTESADTVYNLENEIDTIIPRMKPRYLPNDILLSMFNENRMAQYMSKYSRLDSTKISVIFAAQSDTLPQLRIINKQPEPTDWYTLERSQHNDSLTYWITKPELVSSDSLRIELRSLRTDTANNLVWGTDTLNFNTAISQMMIFVNEFSKCETMPREAAEAFVKLLSPYAPHIAEELWEILGNEPPVSLAPWPAYSEKILLENEIEILIQINGRPRERMMMPADAQPAEMEQLALGNEKVKAQLEGRNVIKVICVPKRVVNIVAK